MKSEHVRMGVRDGRCVSITDVPSGLACNCICAACKRPLVAKKGTQRAHHFAHRAGVDCERAGETTLHLAAKQVLMEKCKVWLPEFRGPSNGWLPEVRRMTPMWSGIRSWITEPIYEAQSVAARTVDTEVTFGEVRADVVFVTDAKPPLLVEIRVTNAVDRNKRRRIRATGHACVEIDLSAVPRDVTLHDLASMVIGGGENAAPRRWVSCPKGERVDERRHSSMKESRARAVSGSSRRRVGVGFDRDVVRGCPINCYQGPNQVHFRDCILCPHHVAYVDGSDRDAALHAGTAGVTERMRMVCCDYPRRPRIVAQDRCSATLIMSK